MESCSVTLKDLLDKVEMGSRINRASNAVHSDVMRWAEFYKTVVTSDATMVIDISVRETTPSSFKKAMLA